VRRPAAVTPPRDSTSSSCRRSQQTTMSHRHSANPTADLVTSWCGQPQHDLTPTRQPVWAHEPLGAVERIRQGPNVRTATPESIPMILGRPMTSSRHLNGPRKRRARYAGNFAPVVRSSA
jgi:hypothetical protein